MRFARGLNRPTRLSFLFIPGRGLLVHRSLTLLLACEYIFTRFGLKWSNLFYDDLEAPAEVEMFRVTMYVRPLIAVKETYGLIVIPCGIRSWL